MTREEEIVERYLQQRGWQAVTFEPDGNVPPDFSLCGRVAVEVMRLSRWVDASGSTEESASIPLSSMIREILKSFDKYYAGRTYWVRLEYQSFPLSRLIKSEKKDLRQQIESGLTDFLKSPNLLPYTINARNDDKGVNLSLTIFGEGAPIQGRTFRLGIEMDRDIPVPDITLYAENIQRCIAIKAAKIAPYKSRYPVWHLVLVDFLGGGLDSNEVAQVRASVQDLQGFDSVSVINCEGTLIWLS